MKVSVIVPKKAGPIATDRQDDYLELIDSESTSPSIYDSISIVEKTGEEALGAEYMPYDASIFSKQKKKKGHYKRRFSSRKRSPAESDATDSTVPFVPLEERWNATVAYHHSHSVVSNERLSRRFELLKRCRDFQESMAINNETRYLFYWPYKAGIGNTLTAMSDVLLLSIYTGRKFMRACPFHIIIPSA